MATSENSSDLSSGPPPLSKSDEFSEVGSGSHKVLHVLVNSRTSSAYFSTTRDVTSKSSSDLDRGRRPKLKSEEFCEVTSLVVEIICDFCEIAGRSSCTLWEPDPNKNTADHRTGYC